MAVESLRLYATRRMLWWALVVLLCLLVPGAAGLMTRAPAGAPMLEVPLLDTSSEGRTGMVQVGLHGLPKPGPNQKRAKDCNPRAAQEAINGGCWVMTKTPPPCPEGLQWEHDGHCWLPVAPAAPIPTTGSLAPVHVAEE